MRAPDSQRRAPAGGRLTDRRSPARMNNEQRAARASTIAAVSATVAAVAAVVIAMWDNVQSRQHNRLSVLPYVDITLTRSDYADGVLTIENLGTGPAIIQGMTIRVTGPGGRDTAFSEWGPAAPLLRAAGAQLNGWSDLDSTSAIGVQQQKPLLRFQVSDTTGGVDHFSRFIGTLSVEVRYASVYGQRRTAYWSSSGSSPRRR